MAVDAVWSEPLSHGYSLQTGKFTGKLQDLRRLRILNCCVSRIIRFAYGRLRTNESKTKQGIISKYQEIRFP